MEHYRCHRVYVTKTKGERDSECVEFYPHNTPLPYNSSSENFIIAAHELTHALHNPAPQTSFSNIGHSQIVAVEQISNIFSKVADNFCQIVDLPKKQPVTKSAIISHKVRPTLTKPIPSEQPNIIEYDDGNSPTSFQRNVHMSPSGPHIILQDVPVPPSRVQTAQPPRVDTGSTSSNLRYRGKKNPTPNFALASQFHQVREANSVTHQKSGFAQEYRNLVKVPDRKIWEISFAN